MAIKCKQAESAECGKTICCHECEDKESCKNACDFIDKLKDPLKECENAFEEENSLQVFNTQAASVISAIADVMKKKKALEEQETLIKAKLQKAMEDYGIKSFDNEIIKVTYMDASVRNSVDSAKLKEKYPDIAVECNKASSVKAFVKIEVK